MSLLKRVELAVKLDLLKGSVNAMLIPSRYGKRLVYGGGYRAAKDKVRKYLEENHKELANALADHPEFYYTTVNYIVYDQWLTKSSKFQKLRKKDVSNFTKNAEDVIFKFLGADDSSIVRSIVTKGLNEPDQTASLLCTICLYTMDADAIRALVNQNG